MYVLSCLLSCSLAIAGALASTAVPACSGCVSLPAVWNTFGYLFNVTVGGQQLRVLSDWTWMSLFVRSGRCMNRLDEATCVGTTGQTFFDERQSSSFRNSSLTQTRWPVTAFAENFTVDYGIDSVCVGKVCSHDTVFQLSDFPFPAETIPVVPFAGIYGLAPVTAGLTEASHPAHYQAWHSGKVASRVGWHTCDALDSADSCLGGDAKFVFGGSDAGLYDEARLRKFAVRNPDWLGDAFYPVRPPRNNYWAAALTGCWIRIRGSGRESSNFAMGNGNGHQDGREENVTMALLDEGSEGLGAPLSSRAYRWLAQQINAQQASETIVSAIARQGSSGFNTGLQSWYTVPCGETDRLPDLVYELEGRENYTIRPEDYVTRLRESQLCYLNVNVWN
ncbi:hypothetical protein CDD80_7076 [Ophiocordyceps camponoti-rufipedis]|uniref:Peptidase A1 domain-containing protein n=1 Tax=Ophiocordyceps camponoti-rufipedis TaxID=2004952 RepID=A0A2C5ZGJ3_9HYPO|nr:hypothetical protein CDD80_7076 [Ophiocordyceps camponoti-rufipedis]